MSGSMTELDLWTLAVVVGCLLCPVRPDMPRRCGPPVREGEPASIVCDLQLDFDTKNYCTEDFTLAWYTAGLDTIWTPLNTSANNVTVSTSRNMDDRRITESRLLLPPVSRASWYMPGTRWICEQDCPGGAIYKIVCNQLDIYAGPENVSCSIETRVDTSSEQQLITIGCQTSQVFPRAKCHFSRVSHEEGTLLAITGEPHYSHVLTQSDPEYYISQCTVNVSLPTPQPGVGPHQFYSSVFPDVPGGPLYAVHRLLVTSELPTDGTSRGSTSSRSQDASSDLSKDSFISVITVAGIVIVALAAAVVVLAYMRSSVTKKLREGLEGADQLVMDEQAKAKDEPESLYVDGASCQPLDLVEESVYETVPTEDGKMLYDIADNRRAAPNPYNQLNHGASK